MAQSNVFKQSSGLTPSFVSGSTIVINVGDVRLAYCLDLQFTRNVPHTPVYGIGGFSAHSMEPVGYSASGSMRLARYTTSVVDGPLPHLKRNATPASQVTLPENLRGVTLEAKRDGNSMLDGIAFNPQKLLLSATFDINVYERKVDGTEGEKMFKLENCRLTGYSFSFTPGELLYENVQFVCTRIVDSQVV